MLTTVSYSDARARLAELWDEAADSREPITLTRRGKEDMALLPADELRQLLAAMHLLRSPNNASRLLAALERAKSGTTLEELTLDELAGRAGLDPDAQPPRP